MRITKRIVRLVIAWDFVLALILTIGISVYLYSTPITFDYAREIFSVSATVLSILFSVFFAALAILIATGDNDFIYFLTEEGLYIEILWNFRVTLFALFIAFVLSIILYIFLLPYRKFVLGFTRDEP